MDTQTIDAGRELDALIAVKIMGWEYRPAGKWDESYISPEGHFRQAFDIPCYSTDDGAAMQVLDTFIGYDLERSPRFKPAYEHHCVVYGDRAGEGWGPTRPLAVCRAVLAAVNED